MSFIDNIFFSSGNLDNDIEKSFISIASELNLLTNNHPEFDSSCLNQYITQLANYIEYITIENNNLTSKNVDLECEISQLNTCFDSFKKSKQTELNVTFDIQDEVIERNEAMCREIISYQNQIVKLQASISKLKQENELLRVALSNDSAMVSRTNVTFTESSDTLKGVLVEKEKALKLVNNKLNNALKAKEFLSTELTKFQNLTDRLKSMADDKWLDDSIMQSYFRALNECDGSISTRSLFVDPVTSELLKHSSVETVREQLHSLHFDTYQYVFFCVNDGSNSVYSDTTEQIGNGTHWSLLFVNNVHKLAFHLDSLNDSNLKHALCLVDKLGISANRLNSVSCESQKNNFECGLNVIINAKIILSCYCSNPVSSNSDFVQWYSNFFNVGSAGNDSAQCEIKTVSQPVVSKPKITQTIKLKRLCSKEWMIVKSPKRGKKQSNITSNNLCTDIPLKNTFSILDSLPTTEDPPSSDSLPLSVPTSNPSLTTPNHKEVKQCTNSTYVPAITAQSNNKACIKIFSDSHGRHISGMLGNKIRNNASVFGWVKPNAMYKSVLASAKAETGTMTANDVVVLMAGTNNFVNGRCNDFTAELDSFLGSLSGPRVVLVGIPFRHDSPSLNHEISKINISLKDIAVRHIHSSFLSLETLSRRHFTKHGLHLNYRGKSLLASLLCNIIKPASVSKSPVKFQNCGSNIISSETTVATCTSVSLSNISTSPEKRSIPAKVNYSGHPSRTFQNNYFLGTALKPPGVPWSLYVAKVISVSGGLSS